MEAEIIEVLKHISIQLSVGLALLVGILFTIVFYE